MRVITEDWKNGWIELDIGLSGDEIDSLIEMLNEIKSNPDHHFHITSDYKAEGGVGQVTFYVKTDNEPDNMQLTSRSLLPGEEIPDW